MNEIQFFVPGEPVAKARARHRQVTTKSGASFVQSYTPKKTASFEQLVRSCAPMVKPTSSPVLLEVGLFFAVPDSWPNWKRKAALEGLIAHTTKPDADNVLKAVKDALNSVLWLDDSQVTNARVFKRYSDKPGVKVLITALRWSPAQITRKDQLILPGQGEIAA